MTDLVPHFIQGKAVSQLSEISYPIYNPAEGEQIAHVMVADSELVNHTVAVAKQAFSSWSATPPIKRAKVLFNFRQLLETHQKSLAAIITREHGKTTDDALGEVMRAIEVVELHCGLVKQLQGSVTIEAASHIDCMTQRQPLGVCVGVSPFNFPVMVPVWMMIPAIACGNSFILKPSEQDPSAAIRLLELLTEAGLPPGVVNVLQGDKSVVDALINHPDTMTLTAVASTPVAKSIYKEATALGKRAHTFGGAKNHCVVMPDADLDGAASAILGAAFGSAGERCMAISVAVIVGQATKEAFLSRLIPMVKKIRVDAGHLPNVDMGPLISAKHRERVLGMITEGVTEGANLIIDGRDFKHPTHPQGFYIGPCLFDDVTENMSIHQQEIFGPVLCVMTVESLDEALALVNRHPYGNGTAIFTRDGFSAREYTEKVQVGMVGINIPIPVPIAYHPFGGWKLSSFGDTNMHGEESINFYTRRKTVTSKWPETQVKGSVFSMPTHE